MSNRLLDRIVELVKNDKELHDAIVDLIRAKIEAEKALKRYREARTK